MLAKVDGSATASNAWIGSVARALGIDLSYLTGQPYTHGPLDQAAVHRLVPPIRRALAAWDLIDVPADVEPAPLDVLATEVRQLHVCDTTPHTMR